MSNEENIKELRLTVNGKKGRMFFTTTVEDKNIVFESDDGSLVITDGFRSFKDLWDDTPITDAEIVEPKQLKP